MLPEDSVLFSRFRELLTEHGPDTGTVSLFRTIIYDYYHEKGRDQPWRHTTDPYNIYVSEIMLQQTQVERVLGKYEEFITEFPDFAVLAGAPLEDVLRVWQGMGYNRRAKALKEGAKRVVNEFNGSLPDDTEILSTFPGIGKATACSIAAFAFNKPVVFIETNIRRVFIHFFFHDQEAIQDSDILPLVEKTLDRSDPKQWYYALMDYGSMLKKHIQNPNRRSAAYTRQSRFEGSDRQVRGLVLKKLLEKGEMDENELIALINENRERVEKIIHQMKHEGFIQQKKNTLRIS
jgi:A/G-specific adenine glycosylase